MTRRPDPPPEPRRPPRSPGPPPAALARPAHARPVLLLLVLVGGATGSLLRHAVGSGLDGARTATLLVNVVGALLLGMLLELLAGLGPDAGARQAVRLGVGGGVLGAFTTYSALAVDDVLLLRDGDVGGALAYGLGSAGAGLLAAVAGIAAVVLLRGRPGP